MASRTRVAVVTGSNKGIGFAIVRGMCKQFEGDVFMTARNEELGKQSVAELNKEGLHPKFHQLDITDVESVKRLRDFLQTNYGGLDVLVNNAGIAYKAASTAPFSEQAEVSMKTNFYGTLNVCEQLFPLLKPHARVSNVSSMVSQFSLKKCSKDIQQQLTNPNLKMNDLKTLMQSFVELAKAGKHKENGWTDSAYGASKVGVTAMSIVQQRDNDRDDILINACCPGYVDTDMTSHKGHKTIDEGAESPLFLALLPPNTKSPKGNYVSEKKIQPWIAA